MEDSLPDTGERMIPTRDGELSVVFARHEFAYRFARQFVADKDVVDVGCGTGYGCKILAESARHVLGLDHDSDAIAYCRAHYSAPNVSYRQADAAEFETDTEFDVAVSFQVIEHLRDPADLLERLKAAVRPNGLIIVTTPNVKTIHAAGEANPFHFSEMNHEAFRRLISSKFSNYRIAGIGYASGNPLRQILQKSPLYKRVGLLLKRKSRIKRVAARALDMTRFRVVEEDVASNAIDLLAVCTKAMDP